MRAASAHVLEALVPDTAHARVRQLVAHWRALSPGPDLLPGRQHFDPMQVPRLLPNLWLLDVVAGPPRRFRYRLVGGAVIEAGSPGRPGKFVDDPEFNLDVGAANRIFDAVVEGRVPVWWRGKPMLRHWDHVQTIERISLPFASDGEQVDLIMNMTLYFYDDGTVR